MTTSKVIFPVFAPNLLSMATFLSRRLTGRHKQATFFCKDFAKKLKLMKTSILKKLWTL